MYYMIWVKSTYCSFDRLQDIQAFTAAASSSFLGSGQTNSFQAVTEHLRQSILQQNKTSDLKSWSNILERPIHFFNALDNKIIQFYQD